MHTLAGSKPNVVVRWNVHQLGTVLYQAICAQVMGAFLAIQDSIVFVLPVISIEYVLGFIIPAVSRIRKNGSLTYLCPVVSSINTLWTDPFVTEGASG